MFVRQSYPTHCWRYHLWIVSSDGKSRDEKWCTHSALSGSPQSRNFEDPLFFCVSFLYCCETRLRNEKYLFCLRCLKTLVPLADSNSGSCFCYGEVWYFFPLSFFIIGPESDHWLCLSLTHWLTHWLTNCRLVNLIDVTLAYEDASSELVEVVTVADDSDEDRVGNSLLPIWKLRFGHKA